MIIGIHANKSRAGKDTAADYLVSRTFTSKKLAFADPLYACADIMFCIDSRSIKDKEAIIPEWGISLRHMLQIIGTEMGQKVYGADIWVSNMVLRCRALKKKEGINTFIFSDVRHNQEAEYIKDNGGIIIHLDRDKERSVRNHVSEAGIDKKYIDTVITNNGTIQELYEKIDEFLLCPHEVS